MIVDHSSVGRSGAQEEQRSGSDTHTMDPLESEYSALVDFRYISYMNRLNYGLFVAVLLLG